MPPATSGQYYGDKSNTKNDVPEQEDVTMHPINQLSCKDSANKISMDYTRITGSPNKNV